MPEPIPRRRNRQSAGTKTAASNKAAPSSGPAGAHPAASKRTEDAVRDPSSPGLEIPDVVASTLASLETMSTPRDRENLVRFGIQASNAIGVSTPKIKLLAKELGHNHALALALWETGCYEARLLSAWVDEPSRVSLKQMESWCRAFDNWAVCETVAANLFARTPHAWDKVREWHDQPDELVKRAAYAIIASLAASDPKSPDAPFEESLSYIERAANDRRNSVKKAVNAALCGVGRRNRALNTAALTLARLLRASPESSARWIGRHAVKELTSHTVKRELAGGTPRRRRAPADEP